MRRIIAVAALAAALFIGTNAHAQEISDTSVEAGLPAIASANAGVTPGSFWYRYDLAGERVWQGIVGIFSRQAELSYIEKRIAEREAEAWKVISEKGTLSDEALELLGRKQDYRLKAAGLAVQEEDGDKVREIQERGWKFDIEYAGYVVKALDEARAAADQVRKDIAAARKAGDQEKLADLVLQMRAAQREEDEALERNRHVFEAGEVSSEKLEGALTGAEKAALVFRRVEHEERLREERKAASDARWQKLLAAFDAARKTAAQGDVKAAEAKAVELQKSLREAGVAVHAVQAEARAKQRRADEALIDPPKAPAPAPRPAPAPKPKLEQIPSESAEQYPLTIVGNFGGLSGEVNKFSAVRFTAEGGLPPYHFQLGTGGGFPPQGVVLGLSGWISGTPRIAGKYTFDVCVVDTVGKSDCKTFAMIVEPEIQEAPQPPPQFQPPPAPAPKSCGSQPTNTCGAGPPKYRDCSSKCGSNNEACYDACHAEDTAASRAWYDCKNSYDRAMSAYNNCTR